MIAVAKELHLDPDVVFEWTVDKFQEVAGYLAAESKASAKATKDANKPKPGKKHRHRRRH